MAVAPPEPPAAPRLRARSPLPATGEEVWLVALTGAGLLLAGTGLSLRVRAARAFD